MYFIARNSVERLQGVYFLINVMFVLVVIADDILCYGSGETMEDALKDHDSNLLNLLDRARSMNLKLNKKKLRLKLDQVTYMGH